MSQSTKNVDCLICGEPITKNNSLCNKCQEELDIFRILNCNCAEENWMTICRDCILNSDKQEKWKSFLNQANWLESSESSQ